MGRRTIEPIPATVDSEMAELGIRWLIRPLIAPPTTDSRVIAYLAEVAADVRSELARLTTASPVERLLAVEALLRSRPLPAERGFSRVWSCRDWCSKFARSAERRWAERTRTDRR